MSWYTVAWYTNSVRYTFFAARIRIHFSALQDGNVPIVVEIEDRTARARGQCPLSIITTLFRRRFDGALGPQQMMWERGTVPLEFRRTYSTETQPDPNMH